MRVRTGVGSLLLATPLLVALLWLPQPEFSLRSLEARAPADTLPSLVVLVRHAERDGSSADDPELTERGSGRAGELARILGDVGITAIHTTDFVRTRRTAEPLANRLGIETEIFDYRDLASLAAALRGRPGRHLVVGHSNTTDELAVLLGGRSHGSIADGWEYDRLYLLTPAPDSSMTTVLMRYGPASEPGDAGE